MAILATNTVLRNKHFAECRISECSSEHCKAFELTLPDARDEVTGSPLSWIRMQLKGKPEYDEVVVAGDFYPREYQGFYHRINKTGMFYQDTCCWHISVDGTHAEYIVHLNHGDDVIVRKEHDLRGSTRENSILRSKTGNYLYFYEGDKLAPISQEDALELVYGKA